MANEPDFEHGEPAPVPNDGPSMHDLVQKQIAMRHYMAEQHIANSVTPIHSLESCSAAADEMARRREFGIKKYGTVLQAHNGRNPINDLIDEIGDALVYARQAVQEASDPFLRGERVDIFGRLLDIYLELMSAKLAVNAS